jgi:hypothetical protein
MSRHEDELQKLFKGSLPAHLKNIENTVLSRITAPLDTRMLDQLGLTRDTTTPFVLFDNACGLGVVAADLKSRIKPEVLAQSSILSGDISAASIDVVQEKIEKHGWVKAEAKVIDAQVRSSSSVRSKEHELSSNPTS